MESKEKQIIEIKKELEKQSGIDEIQEKQIINLEKELEIQKKKTIFAMNLSFKAVKDLEKETRKQVATAMMAAFGFLIALVWKDVITNYTNHLVSFLKFPSPESFQVLYTAILTSLIAVIGIVLLGKWTPKKDEILKEVNVN